MSTQTMAQPLLQQKHMENILVVKTNKLFAHNVIQGLQAIDFSLYQNLIEKEKEFLPRYLMEEDPQYKQIIPYLVFVHDKKIFFMKRRNSAGEQRLKNKYTLGIGGHIRESDMTESTSIIDWAKREFEEEVDYKGTYKVVPLGILNDEENPVGKVHTGFVFLLHGDSPHITIKTELAHGSLLGMRESAHIYNQLEPWSKMVFDYLKTYAVLDTL